MITPLKSKTIIEPILTTELQNILGENYSCSCYNNNKIVYELPEKPIVVIHDSLFMRQFKLHKLHMDLEWSGELLFSRNTSNLLEYNKIVVQAEDFIPYDLGNSTYTSMDFKQLPPCPVLQYIPNYWDDERTDNPEKSIHRGIVHSHHNMSTFFSTVDQPNLINNSEHYVGSMYVSLIVNKDYKWSKASDRWKCRIAWHSKPQGNLHVFKDGNKIIGTTSKPTVFYAECDVVWLHEFSMEDKTVKRYRELLPEYYRKHVGTIMMSSYFMRNFYKCFTGGSMETMDGNRFINQMLSYTDIEEWFSEEFERASQAAMDNANWDVAFTPVIKCQFEDKFVKTTILRTFIEDLKNLGNTEDANKLKKLFGLLIKKL